MADEELANSLQVIDATVERGATVVRQLLTLARNAETNLATGNINDMIVELTKLVKETFPKDIGILVNLGSQIQPVLADSVQISTTKTMGDKS